MNDKQILEHMYFNFIWKICEQIPRFITNSSSNRLSDQSSEQQKIDTISSNESVLLAAKLGILFLLEAYIHARDKPNMLQWIDLLTRLFNSNKQACQWLITYLSTEAFMWSTVCSETKTTTATKFIHHFLSLIEKNKNTFIIKHC